MNFSISNSCYHFPAITGNCYYRFVEHAIDPTHILGKLKEEKRLPPLFNFAFGVTIDQLQFTVQCLKFYTYDSVVDVFLCDETECDHKKKERNGEESNRNRNMKDERKTLMQQQYLEQNRIEAKNQK